MSKTILISGASSGFGALTARALADAGHTVYAGMRDVAGRNASAAADAAQYSKDNTVDLRAVELDVSSDESARQAVATVLAEQGKLDVLIHNAGHMVTGPAEAFTPEQVADLYDTNVVGTQRLNRAALPHLREQQDGLVVWVGSSSTPRRHPAVPGAVLRREGRDGRDGHQLRRSSCPASASRPRSSCRARSPTAPTTSRTAARRPTPTSSRRTRPGTPG